MNRTEIAALFGVSVVTIDKWVSDGMPAVKRGRLKSGEYDAATCVQWRCARLSEKSEVAGDIDAERLRKTKAEADKLEFELSVQQGSHVPIDVLTNTLNTEFSRVRGKMLGLPSKVAPIVKQYLRDEKEINKVFDLLMDEVRIALEQSAEDDLDDASDTGGDSELSIDPVAAEKPKRKPVGRPKGISKPRRLG